MLRLTQSIVKYNYNGNNYFRRHVQSMPWEKQDKQEKKQFKVGDKAEFAYDQNVKFDNDYKPHTYNSNHGFLIGIAIVSTYFTYRHQHLRQKKGRKQIYEFSV